MRDKFPRKKPGDSLEADHVNRLGDVARRVGNSRPGSFGFGRHTDSFHSFSNKAPWIQYVLIVTSNRIDDDDPVGSGLYLGKVRWHDHVSEVWRTDDDETPYEIDASDLGLALSVGDKLTCWWNAQRSMFIPIITEHLPDPLVDYSADLSKEVERTTTPGSEIRFALEISTTGIGGWLVVNSREYASNNISRETPENVGGQFGGSLTGCGFYTFTVQGTVYVRATCQTDIRYARINVDTAAIRLEAKPEGGGIFSTSGPLDPSTVVTGWTSEAEVNNANLASGYPAFTNLGDGRVKIEIPPYEFWTIEAELSMGFDYEDESSSSTSSTSSLSTSSPSSTSSSQSTSSSSWSSQSEESTSSQSSSSSSSSSISTSSSRGLTHVKVVVDVCCEGSDLIVVTQDLLFDAAGHFVDTTERDPPDKCSEVP